MRRLSVLIPVLLAAAATASPTRPGYRVIVNPGNPASSLARSDVARLFMKKLTVWPDGRAVQPVDLERTSPIRQVFSADVHQKDADAVAAHWQVLVFSGRDVPPRTLKSDGEVLDFVRANPGAVGYVSDTAPLSGVKTVSVQR